MPTTHYLTLSHRYQTTRTTSNPSLVLVHGSWHRPEHFEPLVKVLSGHGYKCVPVNLPSMQSPSVQPPASLADDTRAVRDVVTAELDGGHNVVVIAHSYGGGPTNNALQGLNAQARKSAGANTAVLAIVFLCSIPLPAGTSFLQALGGKPQRLHDRSKDPELAYVGEPGPGYYFYNDLSAADVEKYSAMLRPQSWRAYEDETTYAAYMDIPSWYLHCTKDQAFPFGAQQALVGATVEAGAQIGTETVEAAHSPFISMPEETAAFIMKAAGEAA